MAIKTIPIQNLFYLFCYAWNRYQEGEQIIIKKIESPNICDLFAKILINGTNHILRRGLHRGYVEFNEDLSCIRGKISLNASIKKNLFLNAKANCSFDELTYDVLHNQVIKTTIHNLSKSADLNKSLKSELISLRKKLENIKLINISNQCFHRIQLHRNNAYYDFLLKVCELIHTLLMPEENRGELRFRDIFQDEGLMGRVFEDFVRNFYKKEQSKFSVASEYIKWDGGPLDEASKAVLPSMLTDISLRSKDRTVVIDTKYYKEALAVNKGKKRINSSNLYQIFTYLKNIKIDSSSKAEGILLYPTIDDDFEYKYSIQGHPIRVCTINLNQDWPKIHSDLLGFLNKE